MGFWAFMLFVVSALPIMMILFGRYFKNHAPGKINMLFGYRTTMSMKNRDTWEFAHNLCGRVWTVCGYAMLPMSIVPMLFVMGKNYDTVGTVGGIVTIVQVIVLIGSIFHVEKALKKTFDNNGNRV